jgi:hypothetical protein
MSLPQGEPEVIQLGCHRAVGSEEAFGEYDESVQEEEELSDGGGQRWWSLGFVFSDGVLCLVAGFPEVFVFALFVLLDAEAAEA